MSYPAGTLFLAEGDAARFGRRVTAWRALHGVEARELAAELGMHPSGLSRIEHGARAVPVELARRLCEVTGLTLDGDGVSFSDTGTLPRAPSPAAAP